MAASAELGEPNLADGNPLKTFNSASRSLVVTLHVLFPSLLLQALDLLDRGLVTKAIQITPSTTSAPSVPADWPTQAYAHLPDADQAQDGKEHRNEAQRVNPGQRRSENIFYLVQSAQSSHPRAGSTSSLRYSSARANSYIVHLAAWNCSCAAFAFNAFPASTSGPFLPRFETTAYKEGDGQRKVSECGFGGWSFDGTKDHGDGVPCCKHLIACFLAERWCGIFGRYVKLLRAGRDEMAGLGMNGGV